VGASNGIAVEAIEFRGYRTCALNSYQKGCLQQAKYLEINPGAAAAAGGGNTCF